MYSSKLDLDPELKRILWACYECWYRSPAPEAKRDICYSWIIESYEEKFGGKFHQSKLSKLASLDILQKLDLRRGGKRRYYKIVDPSRLRNLIAEWGL